ncbi:arylamine N-acetyltransferase family protein [Pseudomonas benzenivorans]|uniref:Arylamine N-acetyltransferase n=1 Tax=Pseudomonas benzenivorans TaxID=556533 RepID=A0ABY5H8L6_9PSED|nr:arylamine N-acetyltransferase [Pseudomonas benzenivorans]UTW08182.1 arylamine N-acetyltransferase [Pseudomonas benzenivorans]
MEVTPKTRSSLRDLYRLHRAWTRKYSFNNLNALLNGAPGLCPGTISSALRRYGGGYCHELNTWFRAELEIAGFKCSPHLAIVLYGAGNATQRPSHLVSIVHVEDAEYLCDTGFGLGLLWPLRLERIGVSQSQHTLSFRIVGEEGGRILQLRVNGGWCDMYQFPEQTAYEEEIIAANVFSSMSPDSFVSSNLVATRYVGGRRKSLVNTRYQDPVCGGAVRLESAGQLSHCLAQNFGVNLTTKEALAAFRVAAKADRYPSPNEILQTST